MAEETVPVNCGCVHGEHDNVCTSGDSRDSSDDVEMVCLLLSEALRRVRGLVGVAAPAPAPQPEPVPGAPVEAMPAPAPMPDPGPAEAPAPTLVAVPLVPAEPKAVAPAEVKEDRVEDPWFCVPEKRKLLSKYIVVNKKNLTGICKRISNFARNEGVPFYRKKFVVFNMSSSYSTFPAYFLQMVIDKFENDPDWMRAYRVYASKQTVRKEPAMLPGFFSVISEMGRLNKIFVFSEEPSKLRLQKNRIGLSLATITKKLSLSKRRWRGKGCSGSWMYPYAAWEEFYRLVNTTPEYLPFIPRRTS